jgi:hypothetical protein
MNDIPTDSPEPGEASLGDVFADMAQQGMSRVSDGFAETLQGRPIGSPGSPETAFVAARPVNETLARVGREGLDPLMGQGFERETHEMAAEQFLLERGGKSRDRDAEDLGRH